MDAATASAVSLKTASVLAQARTQVTQSGWTGRYIVTPGGPYAYAGIFARDFLYSLDGAASLIAADDIKTGVDLYLDKQLTANRVVGAYTYPVGSVPDHIYPDGRYSWGPGAYYGDVTGHFNRPTIDEHFCLIAIAWHYGKKIEWASPFPTWFASIASKLEAAYNAVPRNTSSGLVTQWTTPTRTNPGGITESNGPCMMWGFHDSYIFPGDDVGTSLLAFRAATCLAEMYTVTGDTTSAAAWTAKATAMQTAIQAVFNAGGWLPWNVNVAGVPQTAPTQASPDLTGIAVAWNVLTPTQADAASDWLYARYTADKASGGAADLFDFRSGHRGTVRMGRKVDDAVANSTMYPINTSPYNCTANGGGYGFGNYQNGGYWYYMSQGVATAIARKHPAAAIEWADGCAADALAASASTWPFENFGVGSYANGLNQLYSASAGSVMGMVSEALAGYQSTLVITSGPFSLAGTAISASNIPVGTRTAGTMDVTSAGGGLLRFTTDKFSLSLNGISWAQEVEIPSGTTSCHLSVLPDVSDSGTLNASLGVPE